jgi:hypothetical protein
MNVLKRTKAAITIPMWALPPPSRPSASASRQSATAITANPVS